MCRVEPFNTARIYHICGDVSLFRRPCPTARAQPAHANDCPYRSTPRCSESRAGELRHTESTRRHRRDGHAPPPLCVREKFAGAFLSSSERDVGQSREIPQLEETPFHPRSPSGVSKCSATVSRGTTAKATAFSAVNASLFHHESPRRGSTFVTRKITLLVGASCWRADGAAARHLAAKRDWGYANESWKCLKMLRSTSPMDFVLATGETHSFADVPRHVRHADLD